ncbi:YPDG domain-containing protein [Corynebacterium faecium]|uniref:YPDG domain-containing protein n=1 Tax=Corynebacterium faecium TaxID=3016001 RepID=UPI0022B56F9A|nr:YPDG domain-containing protein [Corynebacterium faecium]
MSAKNFGRAAVAVATAASLVCGGATVPHALAETTQVQSIDSLSWPDVRVTPGGEVKVKPEGEFSSDVRFSGNRDYLGYSFTTEPRTGEVTIRVADDVSPGERTMFTVVVSDGFRTVRRTVQVDVVDQLGEMAQKYPVEYYAVYTSLDQEVAEPLQGEVPEGTTFSVVAPEHYSVEVDDNGTLTVTQTDSLRFRSNTAAAVTVHYPDGSEATLAVPLLTMDVDEQSFEELGSEDLSDFYNYLYDHEIRPEWEHTVMRGDETAVARFDGPTWGAESFKFREDLVPYLTKRFDVDVDKQTGEVTMTPKRPMKTSGSQFFVPVEVTYSDQSVGLGSAVFEIGEPGLWDNERAELEYKKVEAPTPGPFTAELEGDFPEGTWFEQLGEFMPGWTVDVARTTGEVTVTPPNNTKPNISFETDVAAHFPDGSVKYLVAPFLLVKPENPQSETARVTYPDVELHPGETVSYSPDGLPDGSVVTIFHTNYAEKHGVDIRVDSRTGALTVAAKQDASAFNQDVFLDVVFKDGSDTKVGANIKVTVPEPEPEVTPEPEPEPEPEPTPTPTPEPTPEPTTPAPAPANEGSSTGGIIAIVIGVLAAIGGLAFAAKPQLEQMGLWPR